MEMKNKNETFLLIRAKRGNRRPFKKGTWSKSVVSDYQGNVVSDVLFCCLYPQCSESFGFWCVPSWSMFISQYLRVHCGLWLSCYVSNVDHLPLVVRIKGQYRELPGAFAQPHRYPFMSLAQRRVWQTAEHLHFPQFPLSLSLAPCFGVRFARMIRFFEPEHFHRISPIVITVSLTTAHSVMRLMRGVLVNFYLFVSQ